MNRRELIKVGVAGGALLVVPSMEGCSTESITTGVNVVLEAGLSLLKVIDPTSQLYSDLAASITALQTAEAQWKAGSAVLVIEEALNTVEAVLAVIPFTAPYSILIGVLVAGIDACLALIPTSSSVKKAKKNQYTNRVVLRKPHFLQTYQGAFKEQWNVAVESNLVLAPAKL